MVFRFLSEAVLAIAIVFAAAPPAARWERSFGADVVRKHFGKGDRVAVIVANEAAVPAGAALESSLRAIKAKPTDFPRLGPRFAFDKDDQEIVVSLRDAGYGPARIAVVRVYPHAEDSPPNAVVVLYDSGGRGVSSFFVAAAP